MPSFDPVRRNYASREPGKGPRDVDAAARARFLRAAVYMVPIGFAAGALVGGFIFQKLGLSQGFGAFLGALLGPVAAMGAVLGLTDLAGSVGLLAFAAPGRGATRNDYSRTKALVAHGEYKRAVEEYEGYIAADPADSQLYLELGRLHRDKLNDHDSALTWFRRGLRDSNPEVGMEILLTREAVEMIRKGRLDIAAAAPLLARLAERHADRQEGGWAERELAEVKAEMGKSGGHAGRERYDGPGAPPGGSPAP
jgi:tetratricopeptide (TPR) repeat protein